ncbi:4Fe-4S binding protein [Tissierella pigra]|uniref:NADP-reducing hydrogenase subunit HndC n=1 Tax=Tissierella pigra TaxID=2607614 RepID=A0A6N7Y1U0_9FIRM|nr:NADH-ubiquinone oxidoreductase-F iron-sulfur binding region domain-containing protein [Tissierella pigra]MBU5428124.1 4Fe-4S binding protein [Tissierella pigra]MSU01980.1 NADP-reducing hydrogenase subunit HndC [Tissierella pigra]
MDNTIVCNTVPIYSEAPVSLEILKDNISQVIDSISEDPMIKKYLIVDKKDKKTIDLLKEQIKTLPDSNIEILETEVINNFVYGNLTAIESLIKGEKPIPYGINKKLPIYSVEELLGSKNKAVFINGNIKNKGLFSFNKNVKPRDILNQCRSDNKFKGMYFGYPMGTLISDEQLDDEIELTTDYIFIFDESHCILDRLVDISKRYLSESCGRCVFGHEGTTQIYMILSDIANKRGKAEDIEQLLDLCNQMRNQSLCDIGIAAGNTVITAINNFKEEILGHIIKKDCKAAVCSKFITYHILDDKCNGCNECQNICEEEAILGKKRYIHIIDQDECIQCGSCISVCGEEAIIKAGRIKPKTLKKPIPCKN